MGERGFTSGMRTSAGPRAAAFRPFSRCVVLSDGSGFGSRAWSAARGHRTMSWAAVGVVSECWSVDHRS